MTIALVLALAAAVPSLALASDGSIEIKLKNGAVYRGELVERVPDDHVTIKLATGDIKRFEWADIEPSAPPTSESAASPATPASAAPKTDGSVRVRLVGTPNVTLESRAGSFSVGTGGQANVVGERWNPACVAPCGGLVPPGEYRVGGSGVNPSSSFAITTPSKVDVKAGSWNGYIYGRMLTGAGIGGLVAGGLILGMGGDSTKTLGVIGLVSGGVFLVIGVPLWVSNSTTVKVSPDVAARGLRLTATAF